MRVERAWWILVATSLIGCDAPTVPVDEPAYEPRLQSDQIFHWPLGKAIRVHVDTAGGGAALVEPVRQARNVWRAVVFYREFDLVLVSSPLAADVIVHTVTASLLWTLPAGCATPSGGAGGVTYFCVNNAGNEVVVLRLNSGGPGQVKIDVTIDPSRATGPFTVRSLVAHEIGHVLGIGTHSSDSADLMAGAPTALAPTERDARTLRYLLHQPVDLKL